jgi:hypothetical protein
MFAGCILKSKSIKGYTSKGFVEVEYIKKRHDELVSEMIKRGFNHQSPLPVFDQWVEGRVNVRESINELKKRCINCRKRITL